MDRRSKIFKEFAALGGAEDYQSKDPVSACVGVIEAEIKNLGVRFEPGAAETLASIVAGNPRMCAQEARKLAAYANFSGTISQRDVADMVPIFGESRLFRHNDAFYSATSTRRSRF